MKNYTRNAVFVIIGMVLWSSVPAAADDVYLEAAGPVGLGYVGMYYGLVDPVGGGWYEGEDILFGETSTTWLAIVDTGSSAFIMGKSTQEAYAAGTPIPLQPYPDVKFTDVGFGGTVDFAVTESLQPMLAGQKAAEGQTENHDLYNPSGPPIKLAASLDYIGGGDLDMDIIGTSILNGRVLQVDPHHLEFLRWSWITMAGALGEAPPATSDPRAVYVPVAIEDFFTEPQEVDVGPHPMLPIHVRRDASDEFAARTALFDSGSPVNFVSETFAVAAGIDLSDPADLTITVKGVGGGQVIRDGYYVDALALEMGAGREGDLLTITNTAVFVIPDAEMPGGLEAILGNGILSPSNMFVDTTVAEWYVDMRDEEDAYLIVIIPALLPGDLDENGFVGQDDLDIVLGDWGESVTLGAQSDPSGDGFVGQDDLDIVLGDWGEGTPPDPAPEPASASLLLLGMVMMLRRRRK